MARQNDIEHLQDLMQKGELTADQANVQMVRNERFRMVVNSLPASLRKALNAAVRSGELGHMKKDGHKPECYFHPTFEYLAKAERLKREQQVNSLRGTATVCMSDVVRAGYSA
ncbi:hypothetical protein SAMN05216496_2407 [Pseudomonas sp. Z003-0.4C(8344-21)]|uniref:hypothetical protein n=1 Tax=Pseudomonas sp. Z003-0.4C(8344-21) TaxID=1855380 RepID=UPI0008791FEF|nr:hypothetical protein [Pseudomonas sp. Z003-0.4C(8344-21)]SDS78109.1 hypothetical protein SAMN05216496_2407 [Pseudomonas sp. Z003-0.4C(8344-21)]